MDREKRVKIKKYKIYGIGALFFLSVFIFEIIVHSTKNELYSQFLYSGAFWGFLLTGYLSIWSLPERKIKHKIFSRLTLFFILLFISEIVIAIIIGRWFSPFLHSLGFWGFVVTSYFAISVAPVIKEYHPLDKDYLFQTIINVLDDEKMRENKLIRKVNEKVLHEKNKYLIPRTIRGLLYEMEGAILVEEKGYWKKL